MNSVDEIAMGVASYGFECVGRGAKKKLCDLSVSNKNFSLLITWNIQYVYIYIPR